jgi:hypothetical protein
VLVFTSVNALPPEVLGSKHMQERQQHSRFPNVNIVRQNLHDQLHVQITHISATLRQSGKQKQ